MAAPMPTPPGAATPVSGSLLAPALPKKIAQTRRSQNRIPGMVVRCARKRCRRIATGLALPGRAAEFLAPVLHRKAASGEFVHLFAHFAADVLRQLDRRVLEALDELGRC